MHSDAFFFTLSFAICLKCFLDNTPAFKVKKKLTIFFTYFVSDLIILAYFNANNMDFSAINGNIYIYVV